MVNGRLLPLSGEDLVAYLQAIPAENIERIEVITTPPAQYDAAGNSGLINIVMKKNNKAGFNGNARAGYEQSGYGTGIYGATVNYRHGPLNMYGTNGYTAGAKANVERLDTYYPDQVFKLEDPYKKQTQSLQYTAGIDYELGKSNTLGVQFNHNSLDRKDRINNFTVVENRNTQLLDSMIRTNGQSQASRHTNILNLNNVWTIDTSGKKLSLNANRLWFASTRNRQYETLNYSGAGQLPTGTGEQDRNLGDQTVTVTTAQADFELPYKWAALSLGGKASFVNNNSSSDFLSLAQGIYVNNPAISNAFSYNEAVQALYFSAQKELGKWSFQAGLRGEAAQTKGYSRNLNQTHTAQYFNLFPTAYVAYKVSDAHVLNLNYSKRINRPGYAELNPFRLYSSPYSYTEGNPFLKPSYSHNLELNYTLKQQYNFTAYYQFEQAHFGQVFAADAATSTSYVTFANMGSFTGYGVNASVAKTPARWWEVQLLVSGGVQEIRTTDGHQSYGLPNVYCSASNSFTLNKKKTLLAEANVFYLSRYQQDLFYFNSIASVDTGIKVLLMDQKLVVSLNATDLFASQPTRGVNQTTGQTLNSYFDQRNVRLMLNYKFGSDKLKARRERATGVEEEGGRI